MRVEIDLHRARLPGLREELDVGKRGADHQQRVALFQRLLRWPRAEQADAAGGVRAVVRHRRLAEQRLDDRRAQLFRQLLPVPRRRASAPRPARIAIFLPAFRIAGGRCQIVVSAAGAPLRAARQRYDAACFASSASLAFMLLQVDGKVDVRHAAIAKRGAAGQIGHVLHMRRPHDARVVDRRHPEHLVEFDVLLRVRVDRDRDK